MENFFNAFYADYAKTFNMKVSCDVRDGMNLHMISHMAKFMNLSIRVHTCFSTTSIEFDYRGDYTLIERKANN